MIQKKQRAFEDEPIWATELRNMVDRHFSGVLNKMKSLETWLGESLEYAHVQIKEQKKVVDDMQRKVVTMERYNQTLRYELQLLKSDQKDMKIKMKDEEDYSRRDNLLFKGLNEQDGENCGENVHKLMVDRLGLEMYEFVRIHRLGHKSTAGKRPIISRFKNYQDRAKVWEKRKLLKGSNIFIDEDFCAETTTNRRKLLPIVKRDLPVDINPTAPRPKEMLQPFSERLHHCQTSTIAGSLLTARNIRQMNSISNPTKRD